MYESNLLNFIDSGQIKKKIKELFSVINLPIAILDTKDNLIADIGWDNWFFAKYIATPRKCFQESKKTIKIKGKVYRLTSCTFGYKGIIIPFVLNEVVVGKVRIEGFLFEKDKVDAKAIKSFCEENNLDYEEVKNGIKKIPRFDRKKIEEIVSCTELFLNLISEFFYTEGLFKELYDNYLKLFEIANDSILIIDPDNNSIVDCNERSTFLFGRSKKEIIGKTPYELSPEYQSDGKLSKQKAEELIQEALKGESLQFEWQHLRGDDTIFDAEVKLYCIDYSFTKVILAVVKDITIKKIAEKHQIEKENFFKSMFEKAGDGTLIIHNNLYIECNNEILKLWGYSTKEELIGKHPADVSPETQPDGRNSYEKANEMINIAVEKGYNRFEWVHKKKNGELIPMEVSLTSFFMDGKPYILVIGRDITKRKETEKELKFQKEFLETIINLNPNLVFVKDYEGRFKLVNKAVADIYETTVEELIGKTDADFNPFEEEVQRFTLNDKEVIENLSHKFIPEETISSPSGKIRLFQTEKKGIIGPNNEKYVLGVSTDITELKNIQNELRESQEKFRTLAEKAPISIIGFDKNFKINFVNEFHIQEYSSEGYDRSYYMGKDIRDLAFFVTDELYYSFDRLLVNEVIEIDEYFLPILPDGRSAYFNLKVSPIFKEGNFNGGILILQDISETVISKKNAELVGKNLSITLDSIGDAVIVTDNMGYITRMNPIAEQLTGWKIEEALNKPLSEVFQIQNAITGEKVTNPVEKVKELGQVVGLANHTMLISRDGAKYHIADSAAPIRADDGSMIGIVMIFRDVTDKYISEQILKENEERLRNAQKAGNIGSWELDLETQIFWGSEEAFNIFGLDRTIPVMSYEALRNLIHPSDLEYFDNEFIKLITEYNTEEVEFKIINQKTKETRITLIHTFVIFDENNEPVKVVGTIQDITEKKIREILLKLHNEISLSLMYAKSFEDALIQLFEKIVSIEWIDCGGIYLFNQETKALELFTHHGLSKEFVQKVSYYEPDSSNVKLILKGEPVFTHYDNFVKEYDVDKKGNLKFLGIFPIKVADEIIGCVNIASHRYDNISDTIKESIQAILNQISGILAKLKLEKIKEELQRSLNTLINNLNGIVYRCKNDKEWTMEFLSYACKEITGYDPEDFIGNRRLTWNSIIHYLDQERIWNEVQEALAKREKYQLIFRIITADGSIKWVWEQGEGVFDEKGNLLSLEGYIIDITEQKQLSETIRTSEERYKKIFNLSPQLILIVNKEGKVIEANDVLQKWLGYSKEEVVDRSLDSLLFIEDKYRKNLIFEIKKQLDISSQVPIELDLISKNGEKKVGWLLSSYFSWEEGDDRIMLMLTDVTEKRLSEKIQEVILEISIEANLCENITEFSKVLQAKLSKLMDTTNFFIAFYNKETDKLSLSYFADEVDKIEEFPAGKTMTRYVVTNDLPLLAKEQDIKRLIEEGYVELYGTMAKVWMGVPLKVGNEIIGAVVVQSYQDENAYNEIHLRIMQIVTEQIALAIKRKQYQQMVAESEEKYRTLTEQLPVGIYRTSKEGNILFANQFLAHLLEYESVNELLQENISGYMIDGRSFEGQVQKINGQTGIAVQEFRMKTRKGNIIWVRDTYRAVYDKEGNFLYFDGALENITARKKAEEDLMELNRTLEMRVAERTEELERALEELKYENEERKRTQEALYNANIEITRSLQKEKELGELKTRFMSMISHEYRTPLTIILNSSYIIEQLYEGTRKKEFLDYLNKIRHSIKEMTSLLEEVLLIGKSEAGKLVYYPKNIKIYQFVKGLVDETIILDKNRHNIVFKAKPTEMVIETDEKLLKQTLTNLLSNALKYSPEKSEVVFSMTIFPDEIVFTVKDEGIGISEADLKHLFSPFHRGKNVGTVGGTGLGLAIVKSCVDVMGGKINVHSVLGEGSTFTVSIPLRIVNEE